MISVVVFNKRVAIFLNHILLFFILVSSSFNFRCSSTQKEQSDSSIESEINGAVNLPFRYSDVPVSERAKIFLIALDGHRPSFMKNVVLQRKFWLSKGYKEEEIACYYSLPAAYQFVEAESIYRSMVTDLAHCKPAYLPEIKKDLIRVGDFQNRVQNEDSYLYLYLSSHGQMPIQRQREKDKKNRSNFEYYNLQLERYPFLDDYYLPVGSLKDGPATSWELRGAYRSGVPWEELFLTRKWLYRLMEKYFKNSQKYIVINACYSGGFLRRVGEGDKGPALGDLDRVVAFSSTASDLLSYGDRKDDPKSGGSDFTRAFTKLLERSDKKLSEVEWDTLYMELKDMAHNGGFTGYYSGKEEYYPTPQFIRTQ